MVATNISTDILKIPLHAASLCNLNVVCPHLEFHVPLVEECCLNVDIFYYVYV